jgi:hypothetical protein
MMITTDQLPPSSSSVDKVPMETLLLPNDERRKDAPCTWYHHQLFENMARQLSQRRYEEIYQNNGMKSRAYLPNEARRQMSNPKSEQ